MTAAHDNIQIAGEGGAAGERRGTAAHNGPGAAPGDAPRADGRWVVPVNGMSCASCVRRVEQAILAAPGVAEAAVNLASESATVRLSPEGAVADVVAAINGAGYEVPQQSVVIDVDGMSCASCVGRVERALSTAPGVTAASVNLATEQARVSFIAGLSSRAALEQIITRAGYTPRPAADNQATAASLSDSRAAGRARDMAALRRDLLIAAVLTVPVFVVEMGGHLVPQLHHWLVDQFGGPTLRVASFVLTTLVLFGPGLRFFTKGSSALARLAPDMNALVALGAGAAWAYSTIATFAPAWLPQGSAHVYFEAAAVIVTLILLGRLLEARAKGRTSEAIRRLVGLQPRTARVMRDGGYADIAIEAVMVGDLVQVRPGERAPVDGKVVGGRSYVDEAMISGESAPVLKQPGDEVIGGSVNQAGALTFRAARVGADTVLAQIIAMVERAQGAKLPIQGVVDRITVWFVPAVMAAAALTFMAWLAFGPQPALGLALVNAVAVLIIACPCAMGLATPTSIMVATGRAAELGVLFRNGEALQSLGDARVIAFDKTGTLTAGKPSLTDLVTAGAFSRAEVLRLAASVEALSEHHLAKAVAEAAQREGVTPAPVQDFIAEPGRGVSGVVDGRKVLVGSQRFVQAAGVDTSALEAVAAQLAAEARSPSWVAVDGALAAVLAIADPLRPTTQQAVAALRAMGFELAMISGDNRRTANAIAARLGIDDVEAEVLPDGKVAALERLRAVHGPVAFVGDGVNDAPALAAAEVGVAIGTGTDVAIESADVALMSGDLMGVVNAVALSRASMRNIRENLFWAFGYNAALIPVAAGLLYPAWGVLLSPMLAAGAMALSSVFVLGNALRLRRFTPAQASATGASGADQKDLAKEGAARGGAAMGGAAKGGAL